MLEIRPNCEYCDKDLPANATDAYICTYECTFCRRCVDTVLMNVCPNCGGNFCPRPIRPSKEHRAGLSLIHQPSSLLRRAMAFDENEVKLFSQKLKHLKPNDR